jgi:hypothetical protein
MRLGSKINFLNLTAAVFHFSLLPFNKYELEAGSSAAIYQHQRVLLAKHQSADATLQKLKTTFAGRLLWKQHMCKVVISFFF